MKNKSDNTISTEDAKKAVRTLISWIGDDPSREGLLETPDRVLRSFAEFFAGYKIEPEELLQKTFNEIDSYNDIILLKNIDVKSHCEHHMIPIIGKAHVAYVPQKKVVGLSKINRLVSAYAQRLQIQERLTSQIAYTLHRCLDTKGVAVLIDADHNCITKRGIKHQDSRMVTTTFLGCFENDQAIIDKFWHLINA